MNPDAIQTTDAERSEGVVVFQAAVLALDGGALNVEINLGSIKDEGYRTENAAKAREARAEGTRLRDAALATVEATLR